MYFLCSELGAGPAGSTFVCLQKVAGRGCLVKVLSRTDSGDFVLCVLQDCHQHPRHPERRLRVSAYGFIVIVKNSTRQELSLHGLTERNWPFSGKQRELGKGEFFLFFVNRTLKHCLFQVLSPSIYYLCTFTQFSVVVSASDFESHDLGLSLAAALQFLACTPSRNPSYCY